MNFLFRKWLKEEKGAVAILVALLLLVFVGMTALAIDIGHMVVVRNELQNAADAGALAGAAQLYYRESSYPVAPDPTLAGWVNLDANQAARDTAMTNRSVQDSVEVTLAGNNDGDVQRGHWSFTERRFTPVSDLEPVNVALYTEDELDLMDGTTPERSPALVNAVKVVSHRSAPAAPAFFASIFGYEGFAMSAEAVAYVGYPGSFEAWDFTTPIALCEESIRDEDGNYVCGQGRLINSSSNDTANTGGWTNYSTDCTNVNASDLNDIISYQNANNNDCDGSNENEISGSISVGNGQMNAAFSSLRDCSGFNPSLGPVRDQPLEMTVPVVDCDGIPNSGTTVPANINGCYKVVGAVTIEVVLITDTFPQNEANKYDDLPLKMGNWTNPLDSGLVNWRSFVDAFDLRVNGIRAYEASDSGYYQKTIYAKPSCQAQEPIGGTGGTPTGILAEHPVLVKGSMNY